MANEAVCLETPTRFRRYTIAAGGIAFGTLLKLVDPHTAAATAADNDPFAGIAFEEVTTTDFTNGKTEITVAKDGVWDIRASAAVAIGERVSISGANTVTKVAAADLLFADVGVAEEACAGAETIRINVWAH